MDRALNDPRNLLPVLSFPLQLFLCIIQSIRGRFGAVLFCKLANTEVLTHENILQSCLISCIFTLNKNISTCFYNIQCPGAFSLAFQAFYICQFDLYLCCIILALHSVLLSPNFLFVIIVQW